MRRSAKIACLAALGLLLALPAYAGGPLLIGTASFGVDGQPYTWDAGKMPIQYRVDSGNLTATGTIISNATALTMVQNLFGVWAAVPTAQLSFQYAGPILATGSFAGGDVQTVADFNAVDDSCGKGVQSPIVFDANGSMMLALTGDPNVIGFASPCAIDSAGHIQTAEAMLNGKYADGVSEPNFTMAMFQATFVHEFGHFLGLDHSQINADCLSSCTADEMGGVPTMFPIILSSQQAVLATDDVAWISRLYPSAQYASSYGVITGVMYFSDGVNPVQGVNVIARQLDNPNTAVNEAKRYAVSVVSGYRFTGNPGQSATATYLLCSPKTNPACPLSGYYGDNSEGGFFGSRQPALVGYFEIPVPPGSYTLHVESVLPGFTGGSSMGPLDPPIAMPGTATVAAPISVTAGQTVGGISIVLNGTPAATDIFETSWLWQPPRSQQQCAPAQVTS